MKRISSLRDSIWEADYVSVPKGEEREAKIPLHELPELIESLRREMKQAADALEFERAGDLRDRIQALEEERLRST